MLPPQEMESALAAAFTDFANTVGRELAPTSEVQSEHGLSWTGWFAVVVLAMVAFGLLRRLGFRAPMFDTQRGDQLSVTG